MKKYSVNVRFKNGKGLQFETDDDVRKLKPALVKEGVKMIVTREEYAFNLHHVDKFEVETMR